MQFYAEFLEIHNLSGIQSPDTWFRTFFLYGSLSFFNSLTIQLLFFQWQRLGWCEEMQKMQKQADFP